MKFNLSFNWRLKTKILTMLLFFGFGVLQAQEILVKGKITGDGGPLPGVSVNVKGTKKGTSTDMDGNYSIKAKSTDILSFSYIGFMTQNAKINNRTTINLELKLDISTLSEVVVVGYGTQKKKEVTGAVGQVEAKELAKTTTSDIGAALQGQIAGVSVTSSSGQPGETANILIRGFSSLSDGQNGPLYVVDGIPYDSDPQLSISEIEKIDVLKDAASASIYGTRGAGGVILITTKQGKKGQMSITFNSEYGVQDITSYIPLMTPEQDTYVNMARGALGSNKPIGGVTADIHRNSSWFTNNTTISDIILKDMASIQNHSINVSGGKEDLTYNFNGNFFDQAGVMINSGYKRFNIRSNTQFTKGKWKINTGVTLKRDETTKPNYGVFNKIYEYHAFQPAIELGQTSLVDFTEDAIDEPGGIGPIKTLGGVARFLNTKENLKGNSETVNVDVNFEPIKGLVLTARSGATYSDTKGIKIVPKLDIYNTIGELIPPNPWDVTQMTVSDLTSNKLTFEAILNYKVAIKKNNFSFLLVNSMEKSQLEYYQSQKKDQANESISVFDGYTSSDLVTSNGRDYTKTLIGYLGRIQYNYDGKYIFSGSVRRDGSSQFSANNRWGVFPSASVGWNVSNEDFWEPYKNVVNELKFRASYGTTGNDRFSPYSNQAVVNLGQNYIFGSSTVDPSLTSSTENLYIGTTQEKFANENVKWETTVEKNFGYDFSFFKSALTFSGDFYIRQNKDLLFNVINPPSNGVSGGNRASVLNIGDMQNVGLEYAARYASRGKKGLNWNVAVTYGQNKNTVTKTSPNNPIIFLDNSYVSSRGPKELVSVITAGREAASFFLRETDGLVTAENIDEYKKIDPATRLGELKYVDQPTVDTNGDGIPDKGDGVIDQNDKVYKGSGSEDFNMGLTFNANYKGLDFSMSWYGSYGAEVMNGSKLYAYQSGTHADIYYSWTPENPTSQIPYFNGLTTSPSYRDASDYFLEDASYIRLRNIALGYSLPKKFIQRMGIAKFRIYIQAQNLLTITSYTGFDPEVGNNGFSTKGIDQGTYPISSQYKVGLQFQF